MDMNCNKGEIMISVVSVEDKEQQYKSNSMKNEEAVRTLDADEEKVKQRLRSNKTRRDTPCLVTVMVLHGIVRYCMM